MTKENALRLLNHFKKIGRTGAHRDMEAKMKREYGIEPEPVKTPQIKPKGKK